MNDEELFAAVKAQLDEDAKQIALCYFHKNSKIQATIREDIVKNYANRVMQAFADRLLKEFEECKRIIERK